MDELPVFYRSQKNAWIVTEIFEEWLSFFPQVKAFLESENLTLVAVLIVGRCKYHKYLKVDGIVVQCLPPHVTSLIQPCDQGILEMIKLNYKINLVHSILESQTKGVSLLQFLKNCNVKDSVYWVVQAWNQVKPYTIIQCWKKMLLIQTQDATTQTNGECSLDLLLLDSSSGTESVLIQETSEIVGKLVAVIRKVEGYEAISEKAISE
ncbi:jerky protein homolog-like [Belonocnema kinseyi]|uniref:jerky protein homolog-like n=1 Tax=Belonocnema kinseyi TaxID=2817044 RepID=UPI00143DADAD|nr:jerky protein homolog-like [Belonocnema kinseyi]